MENLALCLLISVVAWVEILVRKRISLPHHLTSFHLTLASEGRFGHLCVDGVVLTRDAGDGLEQHVESWVSGLVTCIATKFLFSVDRNLVAGCSVTAGSSSFVARCYVAA